MVAEIIAHYGRLDALFNNAGITGHRKNVLNFDPPEEIKQAEEVNLWGSLYMIQHVARYWVENKIEGAVVNVSSFVASFAEWSPFAYGISKTSVDGLTRTAAFQLGKYGIRVNSVAPGYTKTEMAIKYDYSDPKLRKAAEDKSLLNRWIEPREIANAAFFLAGDQASAITGGEAAGRCRLHHYQGRQQGQPLRRERIRIGDSIMANIHKSIVELVGNTPPLVELTNYQADHGLKAHIIGKLEYLNPTGSVKDRLAVALIEEALANGTIQEGSTLIDVTSGNTGISLAALGHAQRLKFIPYLEPGTTEERTKIYKGYGLEVRSFHDIAEVADFEEKGLVLDDLIAGIQRIADENGYYYTGQTVRESNQQYHYKTTGPEIWRDTDGKVDYFVAMGGTAGTLVGTGRYLREQNPPDVKIIGVQGAPPQSRPESPPDFTGNIVDGTCRWAGWIASSSPPP